MSTILVLVVENVSDLTVCTTFFTLPPATLSTYAFIDCCVARAVSLFDAMDRVVAELSTPGRPASDIAATVSRGLGEFDIAADQLASWRSRAGEALNRIDGLEQRVRQAKLDAQTERSEAEDLDLLAAISDFQNRQTGYDAALKKYSLVQRLSLFEYIR